jgi:hypothetical protein
MEWHSNTFSIGSDESLSRLIQIRAHEAVIYALRGTTATLHLPLTSSGSSAGHRGFNLTLLVALTRAIRTLALSIADAVCEPMWGLGKENIQLRKEARPALQYLFRVSCTHIPSECSTMATKPTDRVSRCIHSFVVSSPEFVIHANHHLYCASPCRCHTNTSATGSGRVMVAARGPNSRDQGQERLGETGRRDWSARRCQG